MNALILGLQVLLVALSFTVIYTDIRTRTISHSICFSVAFVCLLLAVLRGDVFILGPVLILLAGVFLTFWRLLGGGDSKLLAAYAIAIPPSDLPTLLIGIALLGGVIAVLFYFYYTVQGKTEQAKSRGVAYGIPIAICASLMIIFS
ncbi:TPA: prepilin peptidase [Vibrio vulnificus]|nr:hypothetical protein [Vibrio vulnificus]HDY8012849.1 prepilin peptidase [Vibrio vulnificus]